MYLTDPLSQHCSFPTHPPHLKLPPPVLHRITRQVKAALLTWLQRDCVLLKGGLPSFLRNKLAQTLVAVLQVRVTGGRRKGGMAPGLTWGECMEGRGKTRRRGGGTPIRLL